VTGGRPSDVIRAYAESFGRDGVDAAAQLWDPEIEWRTLETDDARAIRGAAPMRRYYEEWVDTMDDLHGEVADVAFEEGDRAAIQIRASGRGRVSGAPVSATYYVACLVCEGRIVVAHEYADREHAVRAAQALGDGVPVTQETTIRQGDSDHS
jgi:ketosteroid isomerase-like protein